MERLDILMQRITQFSKDRDWDQFHSEANLAKSIAIEAGELLECFQWSDKDFDKEDVKKELADVLNYCLQLCDRLDVDPIDIVNAKMDENEAKYPADKAKGTSRKYTKL